jgi:RecA-family ATPase
VLWGWQDRLPAGHTSLIPGREGIGKSLFLIWLTSQITQGTLPGTYFGSPRPVFYCATEDSWQHTIAPRLIAAKADLELRSPVVAGFVQRNLDLSVRTVCAPCGGPGQAP